MHTIFVPVDDSQAARTAFQYALQLASLVHGRVQVFHSFSVPVLEPHAMPVAVPELLQQQEASVEALFNELESEVPEDIKRRIELEFRSTIGPAAEEVCELCGHLKPSLTVMGMRRTQAADRALFGSTTARVMQRIQTPLLIVPENARYSGVRRVAYATDFDPSDRKALDRLLEFPFLYDAHIHHVHVCTSNDDSSRCAARLEVVRRAFPEDVSVHPLTVKGEDISERLNAFVEDKGIDMMAVLTHRRNFLERLFHSSTSRKLAYNTRVPLLVFHTEK